MKKKTKKQIMSFNQFDPTNNDVKTARTSIRIPKPVKLELSKALKKRNASAKKSKKKKMSMNSFMVHSLICVINAHNSR